MVVDKGYNMCKVEMKCGYLNCVLHRPSYILKTSLSLPIRLTDGFI